MKKLIIANWKMNLSHNQECTWLETVFPGVLEILRETEHELVICPSFTVLSYAKALYPSAFFGAQDCGFEAQGPYTGDISVISLADLQADYCLIGHSERRQYYDETNTRVADKAELLLKNGIKPIICIGETFQEIENKATVLKSQLELILPLYKKERPIIAYEPAWSIGSGIVPSVSELISTIEFIREICGSHEPKILYGGSVEASMLQGFCPLVDGFLIGSASINGESLKKIILSC